MPLFTGPAVVGPLTAKTFDTVKQMALGTELQDTLGNKYKYAYFAGTPSVGRLYQAPAPIAAHASLVIETAAVVGDTELRITNGATAITEGQYVDGTVTVQTGTGLGQIFQIVSHNAVLASGVLVLKLEEPVKIAIPAASTLKLLANRYNGVVISATTPLEVQGVSLNTGTASGVYGWLQTTGTASVVAGAAIAASVSLSASAVTAGSIAETTAATEQFIGTSISAIASGASGQVKLNIK
jgi:hypothetical protein